MENKQNRRKEPINWDERKQKLCIGVAPGAKYGAASEAVRHSFPEHRACAMFCKGKKCKYENAENWSEDEMEIKGLYSNWITENILAMARPNTPNIEKYDMIKQFKDHGIASIINLQLPDEHASCGPGLEPGGFSYSQQDFMDNDIFFYNFGWQDYGVGSLTNILDMVKVMQFALSENKVAVHCHAGLGRTGVLIACYLVYANRMDPYEAIHFIRSKRPPSIQTRSQIICIQEFAQYLKPLRIVFSSRNKDPSTYEFTLHQFLIRQSHILHGVEARCLKYVPKIIHECCENLLNLAGRGKSRHLRHDRYEDFLKTAPSAFNNINRQKSLIHASSVSGLTNSLKTSISLESFTALNVKTIGSKSSISISRSGSSSTFNSEYSDYDSVYSSANPTPSSSDHDLSPTARRQHSNSEMHSGAKHGHFSHEDVAVAMAETKYDDEVINKVKKFREAINTDFDGYDELHETNDPILNAKLMWDWLDELKEPILHAQDLPRMLEFTNSPREGLKVLNKGAQHTIGFIFKTVARLEPLSDETERALVQRILSTLTHQNMVVEMNCLTSANQSLIQRTSNNAGIMRSSVATKMIYFFMHYLHLMQTDLSHNGSRQHASSEHSEKPLPQARSSGHKKSAKMKIRQRSFEAEDAGIYEKLEDCLGRHAELDEDWDSEEDDEGVQGDLPSQKSKSGLDLRARRSTLTGLYIPDIIH